MAENEPPKDDKTATKPLTLGDLKSFIDERIGALVKGGTNVKEGASPTPEGPDGASRTIQAQVAEQLEKLKAKEARDAREKSIDEQLAALAAKTAETPPVERRRVHKIMGWGE